MEAEWMPEQKPVNIPKKDVVIPLSPETEHVRSFIQEGNLKGFVTAYVQLLQNNNSNLLAFLSPAFNIDTKNILEFLHTVFKNNVPNEEWNVTNLFITIMNLGITIKDEGSPVFYDKMMLTTKDTPSPIYQIVSHMNKNKDEELNKHFISLWNTIFKKEDFVSPTLAPSFMSRFSKSSQLTMIAVAIALMVTLFLCATYFLKNKSPEIFGTGIKPTTIIDTVKIKPSFDF